MMTESEALVLRLCKKSFLSLWSIANPRGKEAGKELCDVLVVCEPDVIIFSVKEIAYQETDDVKTGLDRWTTRAVEESIKQVYGAERLIDRLDRIVAKDGSEWLFLPPQAERRVHRIAVALGSNGEVPISEGKPGKRFVHVLDEAGLDAVLTELDTITDFVDYLSSHRGVSGARSSSILRT